VTQVHAICQLFRVPISCFMFVFQFPLTHLARILQIFHLNSFSNTSDVFQAKATLILFLMSCFDLDVLDTCNLHLKLSFPAHIHININMIYASFQQFSESHSTAPMRPSPLTHNPNLMTEIVYIKM
jgi:hypothetical protein